MEAVLRRVLSVLVVAVLACSGAAAQAAPRAASAPSLPDPALQALLQAEHDAGMPGVFAEVRDGHAVWRGAAGVADVRTGRPVRPWFEQRIGSITKTFVATVLLQLAGERRVDLDAPAARYLPGLGVPAGVTVRMLLQHTSGIGNYTDVLLTSAEDIVAVGHTVYRPRQLARIGLGMPRTGAPGAHWSYSNTNYILAGLIIERVTGHRYGDEIRRRILRPLGLRHTYLPGTDPYLRGPHSAAYVPWPDGTLRDFSTYDMSWGWAAGEMVSTTADLNRFYRALLGGRLLEPRLLTQMETTVPVDPTVPDAGGYGLGLLWIGLPCGRAWGHTGGVIGMTTISVHRPPALRDVSTAENMTFYASPSPIDAARAAFLVESVCGPGLRAAAAPELVRVLDAVRDVPPLG